MSFLSFFKDKISYLLSIIFLQITIAIFLMPYNVNEVIIMYIIFVPIIITMLMIFLEYKKKKSFYDNVDAKLNELDEKYLLSEVIDNTNFIEAEKLEEYVRDLGRSMIENVNKYKFSQKEYKEYIEMWIHEIKIPISVVKLIIENNRNEVTKSIEEEIDKIENFIEQALFYARSSNVEKDYSIKKAKLKDMVNESIKRNKNVLIQSDININVHDLDNIVYTDSKWIIFIINQIIQNCIKYSKDINRQIEIYSKEFNQRVELYILDNGIGIDSSDLPRVFDKGFTGKNGRIISKKSTGIGLYLCKKLCDKLGIGIEITSKINETTCVILKFPKGTHLSF